MNAQHTPEFKMEVCDYSDKHGPALTAAKYDIPVNTVHQWRYQRKAGKVWRPIRGGEAIEELTRRTNGDPENGKTGKKAKKAKKGARGRTRIVGADYPASADDSMSVGTLVRLAGLFQQINPETRQARLDALESVLAFLRD